MTTTITRYAPAAFGPRRERFGIAIDGCAFVGRNGKPYTWATFEAARSAAATLRCIPVVEALRRCIVRGGLGPHRGPFWTVEHIAEEIVDLFWLLRHPSDRPTGWRLPVGCDPVDRTAWAAMLRPDVGGDYDPARIRRLARDVMAAHEENLERIRALSTAA